MEFKIILAETAAKACDDLARTDPGKLKRVYKTFGLLQTNPTHPSLQTHEYRSLRGPNGEKVFEAYVENKTPAAFRVFWYYGPGRDAVTVVAVTPHP
jgi:hypothetical protein